MNKNLLMTYEQYVTLGKFIGTYTYKVNKNNKYLYYFGSRHSFDLKHEQFESIRKFFNDFVIKTEGTKRIVLVEGGNWPVEQNEEIAIKKYGEMGFTAYLANQYGIERKSPEPTKIDINAKLLRYFSKKEILYFRFLLRTEQWQKLVEKPLFKTYIETRLKNFETTLGWSDISFSLENLYAIHKELFHTSFDENDTDFIKRILNPINKLSPLNKILCLDSEIRDQFVLSEVEKYWNEGTNIFIIYGLTHAVMQEPVLRTLT